MGVQPGPIYGIALSIAGGLAGVQIIRHALRGIPGRADAQAFQHPLVRLSSTEVAVRVGLGGIFVLTAAIIGAMAILLMVNQLAPDWLVAVTIGDAACMLLLLIVAIGLAAVRRMRS